MNAIKTFTVAALFAVAASSAFASDDDGNRDNAWLNQTQMSQAAAVRQAPAPVASAAVRQDRASNAAGQFDNLSTAVTP